MPMTKLLRRAAPWLPPLAMMAVIFALSSMPAGQEEHGTLYVVSRKLAHLGEYALLAALWWRALLTKLPHRRALPLAFVIAVLYAATDELHQTFVSGRAGTPVDVGIDAVGALTAVWLIARVRARRRVGA
jgi:VanZ family protein